MWSSDSKNAGEGGAPGRPGGDRALGRRLLEVQGVRVGADGCVPFGRTRDRVPFPFLTTEHFIGDTLPCLVWRDGAEGLGAVSRAPWAPSPNAPLWVYSVRR